MTRWQRAQVWARAHPVWSTLGALFVLGVVVEYWQAAIVYGATALVVAVIVGRRRYRRQVYAGLAARADAQWRAQQQLYR